MRASGALGDASGEEPTPKEGDMGEQSRITNDQAREVGREIGID